MILALLTNRSNCSYEDLDIYDFNNIVPSLNSDMQNPLTAQRVLDEHAAESVE